MGQEKVNNEMTVAELARMTNIAFTDLETRMQVGFIGVRRDIQGEIHGVERRLIDAINGIEVRKPEFEALKNDIEDLSGRVGFLEKKP